MMYVAGIAISLFLLLLLISKKQKNNADKIMTVWFFFAVIHLAYISWYALEWYRDMPALMGWEMPFPLLHGPFLYLYVLYLTNQQQHRFNHLWHFAPFVAGYVILAPVILSMPPGDWLQQEKALPYFPFFSGFTVAIILSGLIYISLSLVLLHRHRKNITNNFSSTDKITLNWLRYLIGGMGVIWAVVIFYRTTQSLYISVALFMFFIGYFGIKQVGIFSDSPLSGYLPAIIPGDAVLEPATDGVPDEKIKYERTGLTESEATKIHTALISLMQEKQLYKQPELTLGELAKELQVHPSLLSQVINSLEQKSFYDYINTLRVEAFKQLVLRPESQKFTLLSLAFECGFNSKSTFNRNFKKMTELSPRDYLKLHHIDMNAFNTGEEDAGV